MTDNTFEFITADQLRDAAQAQDRAALLEDIAEAVRARDESALLVALGMAPFNGRAYVQHLRAMADATDPAEPNDPERLRAAQVTALQASATAPMDDEMAVAILDGMQAWIAIQSETPEQKAICEAFTHARTLMDTLGDNDPRTFAAVVKAVNLQEPGCIGRMLKESGIHLPKPDRCADDGAPLFSLEAVAAALGADPEELLVKARELEAHGLGVLHINANTHTLQ